MGHIYRIMKDGNVIDRTKKMWDRKYSKIDGCSLWEWLGKGNGWKFLSVNRNRSKLIMEPSLCITEADKILYRINIRLADLHRKRKIEGLLNGRKRCV